MKNVVLRDPDGFLASSSTPEMKELNEKILVHFLENDEIYVSEDIFQRAPQGYMFFVPSGKDFLPLPIGVYDWELEQFFEVFD